MLFFWPVFCQNRFFQTWTFPSLFYLSNFIFSEFCCICIKNWQSFKRKLFFCWNVPLCLILSWINFQSIWKLLFFINTGFLTKENTIIGSLTTLEITARHRSMTDENFTWSIQIFSQPVVNILNLSTKLTIFHCSLKICIF